MSFVEWLNASAYATGIRESLIIYPLLQVFHILGFSLLAGAVTMMNLRVMGLGRQFSIADGARYFMPWAWLGFAVVLVTGGNMAISFIEVFAVNTVMHIKLILIGIVASHAAVRHYRIHKGLINWDSSGAPISAKLLAALSVLLWISVITMGKLLAYIGGKD